jgi:hypothetical protein
MTQYIIKNCKKHGNTQFRERSNKKSVWYTCDICLHDQWARASAKRRSKPSVAKYNKDYSNSYNKIRKSLSIYLTMILLAADIKPE